MVGKRDRYKLANILAKSLGDLPFLASAIFYIRGERGWERRSGGDDVGEGEVERQTEKRFEAALKGDGTLRNFPNSDQDRASRNSQQLRGCVKRDIRQRDDTVSV